MLNLGSLWIELWDGSDAVLWVVTSAVVSGLLVLLLYYGRNGLERILNAGQMDRLLKLLIVYLLCLQPVLAMVFLYRGTFGYVGPPKFGDGFIHEYRHYPVSFATGFWTQLVFWLVMAVWAAGFLVCMGRSFRRDRDAWRELRTLCDPCEDGNMLELSEELGRELGLEKPVPIRVSGVVGTPFAAGCFRQELFFPRKEQSREGISLILRHELIHCRRRDPLYRKMIFWLCSLYWFLPPLRRLAEYYTDINEMSCDDAVLERCSRRERYLYAKALADMGLEGGFLEHAVSMTGHTESQLERRLKHMMNRKKKAGKAAFAAMTAMLAAACPLTTLAASEGMCSLQDVIVREVLFEDHEEVMNGGNTLTEETDVVEDFELTPAQGEVWLSGSMTVSTIEEEISSARSMGSVTVSAGDEIHFTLKGDPSSVSFRAGYINSANRRTYVTTTSGKIDHTFTMSKAGTYELFVEPLNNRTVYMEGTATVM
ncbi:MAG: hypothetical protein HFI16_00695 [Lachnospiraceae bacterium]|nr:hypothetical protein [Lachnospiraceae bacterium]